MRSARSQPRLIENWQSERSVINQLRAACGGLLSSSASIHSGGNRPMGVSPCAVRNRSKDSAAALRSGAFGCEEGLQVEILGDDGTHTARLDPACTDGGTWPGHCPLISRHELRRPGQAGKAHAWKAASTEVAVRSAFTVNPGLTVSRESAACRRHCFAEPLGSSMRAFSYPPRQRPPSGCRSTLLRQARFLPSIIYASMRKLAAS